MGMFQKFYYYFSYSLAMEAFLILWKKKKGKRFAWIVSSLNAAASVALKIGHFMIQWQVVFLQCTL